MKIPKLKIGVHEVEFPIIQGGMGVGVSLSGLASSVTKCGGIGVISGASIGFLSEDFRKNPHLSNINMLKKEISKARDVIRDGVVGVNLMVAQTDYENLVKASLEAGADIIFSGAGLPLNLPKLKQLYPENKTALVPIISSPRAAKIICKKWIRYNLLPDAFVLEGPKAGGHLGYSLEELKEGKIDIIGLLKQTKEAISPYEAEYGKKIPVIVAGGVYSGEDIANMIKNGASGVQMATRFVTTDECDASIKFKEEYIRAKKQDIVFIKSPVGLPGRAIRNKFLELVEKGEKMPVKCPYHCIKTCNPKKAPYCISLALINAQKGDLDNGFAFAGENAYRATKIIRVKELFDELIGDFLKAK